jgi:dCTP deaminase
MAIMPDHWIREMAVQRGMIEPFVDRQTREGVISYGLSSYGYDARVAPEFKIFTNVDNALVDPKNFSMIVNVTPLEPEWEGHVTLEISNTTPLPARVYAHEGICQFLFLKGDDEPLVSYADRRGKYMKQKGVTLPRL